MTIATINALRTADRIANMRRLIEELGKRDMTRADIQELTHVSRGGARFYLQDLSALVHVIKPPHRSMLDHYRLTSDAERVAAFIANLGEIPEHRKKRNQSRSREVVLVRDPTRHFHFLFDDAPLQVELHRGLVRADPRALPVEFFRSVGAGVACG